MIINQILLLTYSTRQIWSAQLHPF